MKNFTKQLIFIASLAAVLVVGGLAIKAGVGNLKVNPILGHDLDLDAKYYAQAANNTVHSISTEDFSFSAWYKHPLDARYSAEQGLITKSHSGWSVPMLMWYIDYYQLTAHFYDGTNVFYARTGPALNDNKWHHLALTIDRDNINNCHIWVDGTPYDMSGNIASIGSLTNLNAPFEIGTGYGSLDGQIRDVKLYYAAGDHWSDAQVLYQAGHPFDYTANAGTLTDYWRLDEGTGTTLYGKVNNLTLSNVLAWTTQPKIKMVKQENSTTTSNNPVGWWKMDEGTASSSYDSSGNGNTGTLYGGVQWATGKLGKGISLDGNNDYVQATVPQVDTTAGGYNTISFWMKWNGTTVKVPFAFQNTALYCLYIHSNSCMGFNIGSGDAYGMSPASVSLANRWAHITLVFYNGAYTGNNKIYVDGVSQTLTQCLGSAQSGMAQTIAKIGRVTSGYYFPGLIDDVRIYNRALSAGEVAQMYNSSKDGYLGNIKVSTGLVGYWKLDDNNALTSVIDYSGKGNTGTAYSGTATSTSVLSTSTAMIGRAMSFNGTTYVDVGSGASLNITGVITLSAWIKPTNSVAVGDIIAKWGSGTYADSFILRINSLYINFYISPNGVEGNNTAVASLNPVLINVWSYVVATWDGSKMRIYLNGVENNSIAYTTGICSNSSLTWLGRNPHPWGNFNGLIDEVKIWNYARSAEQIKNDYIIGLMHREE